MNSVLLTVALLAQQPDRNALEEAREQKAQVRALRKAHMEQAPQQGELDRLTFELLSLMQNKSKDERKAKPSESEEVIDLHAACKFHVKLLKICVDSGIEVLYEGALAFPLGRPGRQRQDDEYWNSWMVVYSESKDELKTGLFRIRISPQKSTDTIVSCKFDKSVIYVEFVKTKDGIGVDDKLPLSSEDWTPRKLLKRLEK
jgi:hypothetical protein